MKKLLVLFLALIFATAVSVPVLAENDFDLVCTQSYTDDGKVIIKASVTDIMDETGIVLLEYHIKYDETLLRLDSFKASFPESWEPFFENEMAEDNTTPIKNGLIWWVLNAEVGYGVKDNDELSLELEFSFLTDSSADVEFNYKSVGNDNLEYMYGPDRSVHVEPIEITESSEDDPIVDVPSEVESSEDQSGEVVSGDVESSAVESSEGESTVVDSEVDSGDVESGKLESDVVDSGNVEVPDEPNEDESNVDSSASSATDSESSVVESSVTSGVVASSAAVSDNSVSNDDDGGNGLVIAIIAAAVIIVGAMVVIIVKKGKDK